MTSSWLDPAIHLLKDSGIVIHWFVEIHDGVEVLGLPSVVDRLLKWLLLFWRDFLFSMSSLLQIINDHEGSIIILFKESLVMEIVELGMELVSLIDSLVHVLNLSLQLLNFSHLLSQSSLFTLFPQFCLCDLDLASSSLKVKETEIG